MRKYRYKKGNKKEKPTAEQIEALKDFSRVKQNYERATKDLHRKRLYRDPKLFLGLLLALIILYLIWDWSEIDADNQDSTPKIENTTNP